MTWGISFCEPHFKEYSLSLTGYRDHLLPRVGQTFAKCDGSPQRKHLLATGSPVADTNVEAATKSAVFGRPLPRLLLPRLPLLLELDADDLLLPPCAPVPPPLAISSQLHSDADVNK